MNATRRRTTRFRTFLLTGLLLFAAGDRVRARSILPWVRETLAKNAGPDVLDERGYALLHHAAAAGDLAAMDLLLRHGATLDLLSKKEGLTPLGYAALYARSEAVKHLLAKGASPSARRGLDGWPPLYCAAVSGDGTSARLLRGAGAKAHELLFHQGRPEFLLTLALKARDVRAAEILLDAGADADPRARMGDASLSTLAEAVSQGDPHLVKALLAHGADPNRAAPEGTTPLHQAAAAGRADLVALLLQAGAKRTARLGQTPPGLTVKRQGQMLLVSPKGAEDSAPPKILPALSRELLGKTPADLARRNGHAKVAALIATWSPGTDPFLKTTRDLTKRVDTLLLAGRGLKRVYTGIARGIGATATWPCRLQVGPTRGRRGAFDGWIEWTNLDAKHRIEGLIREGLLTFTEVSAIRKGKAALGTRYRFLLTPRENPFPADLRGTWSLGAETGSLSLRLRPEKALPRAR